MKIFKNSDYNKINIISTLLCFLPIIIGLVFYSQLPEQVAIHFNAQNQPDNYASKFIAIFVLPLGLLLLHVFVIASLEFDSRKKNTGKALQMLSRVSIPIISTYVVIITIAYSLQPGKVDIGFLTLLLVATIFLIIGNLLPKCKPNVTVGIKLPTTLSDETNWNKTHRFGGIVWVVCALVMYVVAFVKLFWLVPIIIGIMVIVPIIYSYVLASKAKKH